MEKKVRVRFAPSPTGPQHIGGIRTALYNYLFARAHDGDFILRIEDTDQQRLVRESESYLIKALEWLDITPDESPQQGGPYAPYRQSERKAIYQEYISQLIRSGKAYYAFDTPEELEEMRERQKKIGVQAPKYNAITRMSMKNSFTLSEEEIKRRIDAGEPYVVRMLIDHQAEVRFKDAVRGWIQVQASSLDDKVLMKADGMPTYHLANVIDDHLMEISHVIRGEEWLPSAPIHVLLYHYMGWETPIFAHLPLILKADGKGKLSKRSAQEGGFPLFPLNWQAKEGGVLFRGFKETGYLPDALLNFLALLGWHPGGNHEILSREELIKMFSLEGINKAGARFDINKAQWMNQQHLSRIDVATLATDYLIPYLQEEGIETTQDYAEKVCLLAKERAIFPVDLWRNNQFFFIAPSTFPEGIIEKKWQDNLWYLLEEWKERLGQTFPVTQEEMKKEIEELGKKHGIEQKKIMPMIRLALTGTLSGPLLMSIIGVLGPKEVIVRLNNFLCTRTPKNLIKK